MKRRTFLKAMAAGTLAGPALARAAVGARRPNIVILVTDDQGYADLSAYPHAAKDVHTPHMDRIAKEGVLLTQGYVSAPVCSPSRAGWNTGLYQQRWGHWSWGAPLPATARTLAERLKAVGYVTGKVGKSDFGTHYHSLDVREYPLNHGYDEFLGFSSHAHDYWLLSEEIEKKTPDPHGGSAALGPLFENRGRKEYDQGYLTTILTDAAVDFLKRHRDDTFLLTVAYNSVHHLIHEVPDEYLKKHGVKPIPNYDPDKDPPPSRERVMHITTPTTNSAPSRTTRCGGITWRTLSAWTTMWPGFWTRWTPWASPTTRSSSSSPTTADRR